MSLFGQSSSTPSSSGGGLFSNLGSGANSEQPAKRRTSIFAPSGETAQQQSQTPSLNLFGSTPASSATTTPLFGATQTTPTPSGGLFSGLGQNTSQQPASGGMFSGLGQNSSQQPASGGLFSGLGQSASQQPASGGLFSGLGQNTAQQPASGGLFSGLGSSASQQSASQGMSGGLFGPATGQSSNQQPAPGFSSVGLGQNPNQQSASGGLFPGSAPPAVDGTFTGPNSVFAKRSTQEQPHNQSQSERSQTRDPAHFSSLLERQKKKPRFTNGNENSRLGNLPSLNMDLGDLARRAQEIGGRGAKVTVTNGPDSRAHYLLAGSGVAPGKAYKDFQALDRDGAATDYRPTEPFDPDNEKYVRNLQQRGREAMIRESMDRVNAEFDTFLEESLNINFNEQRRRIMEHFGLAPRTDDVDGEETQNSAPGSGSFAKSSRKGRNGFSDSSRGSTRSVFGRSALDKSMIGTPGMGASTASFFGEDATSVPGALSKGQNERYLRDKERFFIQKVEQLNKARLDEKKYPILQEFGQVESSAGGDSPHQLVDAYEALREIVNENALAKIKERQYATVYEDEQSNSPKVVKLRRQILDGSRSCLEKSFYRDLESLIERNPREAQLGGRPTTINKIRAYIRVRSARKDLAPDGSELQQIGDNGDYCWIIIFYLLRCGFLKEAAEYVSTDPAFQSTDKRFISYMTTYANSADRKLSRKLQEMVNGEYQQRLRIAPEHSIDPYRMACYKIVGRCDLQRRNLDAVGQGVEDWIWLQFSLAREYERIEELSGEIFGLEQICETVREIGQKHFQKGQAEASGGYGTYFFMQILAGMFEEAIAFLHSYNAVSAVHFAIALAYYGLLRVSDYSVAGNELLTYSTTQRPLINFVPLLAYHTATFRTALPTPAVDYLSLICLNSDLTPASLGSAQTSACHECLRQLCLETREFAKLLGDIRSDGTRIPGSIEQRANLIKLESHEDFLKAVTLQAAAIADERGQIADAVLLYHLCEDYDNVVSILNRALADAATLDLGETPMQLQPLKPRRQAQDGQSVTGSQASQADVLPASSLSLTQNTSSPTELAKNMIALYNSNAAYYNRISATTIRSIRVLLGLLDARAHLEAAPPRCMDALEALNALNILPLKAGGSIPVIRAAAAAFGSLPQVLARCAGVSVVWAITAIGGEREALARQGGWDGGFGDDREAMKEQLSAMAKDLMVFAGLVKYKLPARVYDMLTKVGGDVGGY